MRKKTLFTVTDAGRDKGKMFLITEMSASKSEAWAMRCLLALAAGNVQMPDDWESLGMAGLAEIGIKAVSGLKWDVAEPLLAEMMECVQWVNPAQQQIVRALIEDDIEEVKTRLSLRMEVWKLHMDFLSAVVPSTFHEKLGMAAAHHGHGTATSQS